MNDVLHIEQSPEDGQKLPCPNCGKPLAPFVTDCPDCTARIVTTGYEQLLREHRYSFGLGELMLVIGSVAFVLATVRIAPEVTLFVAVLLLIALIRILGALHRARGWKVHLSTRDVISLIATSLGLALLIVVSSAIAFFATCFPTGIVAVSAFGYTGGFVGMFLGVGIGIVAAIWIARKLCKAYWSAGTPPKLLGIHYLDEMPEIPPVPDPETPTPDPPR